MGIARSILPSLGAAVLCLPAAIRAEVGFNRDIRPIMSDTCFRCHGPDKSSRMMGLRLDIREEALQRTKSGVIPIVPGHPEQSEIVRRIFATDAQVMPPAFAHKELSEKQKLTIRQWVAEGAKYEGHWAYMPVRRPTVPDVKGARTPVDAFILARLAKEGLQPSPLADRRTLIRRLTLDLIGLPPTPAEVDAFLRDTSPNAYEKLVDRLLDSPRYAEKQAIYWLDAVRYADTCGFYNDGPVPAWPYRDYVLRSFRDNKPFDQFTREQLAGDLLPDASQEQLIASAYNKMTRSSTEGGIQPKEYLAKYGADRVRTLSTVWLGSTLGCAECHDHKFDPFTARDFYSMKAFFADIQENGIVPHHGPTAFGTKLSLPTEEQQRNLERLMWQRDQARQALDAEAQILAGMNEGWDKAVLTRQKKGDYKWHFERPYAASSANGAKLTIYTDEPVDTSYGFGVSKMEPGNGMVVASGPNPDNDTYTVSFRPGAGTWTALGLEVLQHDSLTVSFARGGDRLLLTEVEAELDGRRKLGFSLATSNVSFTSPAYHPMAAIDGDPKTGWGVDTYGNSSNLFLALRLSEKVTTTADSVITVRLRHDSEYRKATIGRFRLALSSAEYSWPEPTFAVAAPKEEGALKTKDGVPEIVLKALETEPAKRTEEDRKAMLSFYEFTTPQLQKSLVREAKLAAELGLVESAIPQVMITRSTQPRVTRILPRGDFMNDSGDIVEPAIPGFLGKLQTDGHRATRLDLANWLMSPENPLPARVFVNRLWKQFFGAGISIRVDDFGSQGEWPQHAELLDWLAAEFMEPSWRAAGTHRWDVKHAIRTIVTSQAYRQSALSNPQLDERDPDNRLLARQSRFRVDAETVRDVALAVSGLLVERFGGPSVHPYQPEGYLVALGFPKRDWSASHGEDLYRRGVYTFWQRMFVHPSLSTFDAPSRDECTMNRVNSNTPLQALVLLNDPVFVEASRVFAQNMLRSGGSRLEDRIDWAFQRALSRRPTPQERAALVELYRQNLADFSAAPAEARRLTHAGEAPVLETAKPADLAALTTVARAILNLHETITRN